MSLYRDAFLTVFKKKSDGVGLVVTSAFIFILLVSIPARIVPGNDILFQLSIMPPRDYILFAAISILTGLSISYNWYIYRRQSQIGPGEIGRIGISGFSAVMSSLVGGVTCIACTTTFLSFLGIGGMLLVMKYKLVLTILTFATVLMSLYYNSRKVLNACDVCHIRK